MSQFLVMAATVVGFEIVVEVVLAATASSVVERVANGAAMRRFNRATGGVSVLAGAYLLTL